MTWSRTISRTGLPNMSFSGVTSMLPLRRVGAGRGRQGLRARCLTGYDLRENTSIIDVIYVEAEPPDLA